MLTIMLNFMLEELKRPADERKERDTSFIRLLASFFKKDRARHMKYILAQELDSMERMLAAEAGEHPGDSILERLQQDDPTGFDYYLCSGDKIRSGLEQFFSTQAIPKQQVSYETL